jgi:internalin A
MSRWTLHIRGLMYLQDLTNLQTLYLGFTRVSDAGLVHLKGSINLEHLSLVDTQITDAGLVHLNDLTGLKSLYIGGTKISDGGLSYLKKTMLGLRILDLTNGDTNRPEKVTVAGVQVLQRARPNVRIDY